MPVGLCRAQHPAEALPFNWSTARQAAVQLQPFHPAAQGPAVAPLQLLCCSHCQADTTADGAPPVPAGVGAGTVSTK